MVNLCKEISGNETLRTVTTVLLRYNHTIPQGVWRCSLTYLPGKIRLISENSSTLGIGFKQPFNAAELKRRRSLVISWAIRAVLLL